MPLGKIILTVVIGLIFCNSLQAGITPYKYRELKVTVLDNDTKEPIPNAKVKVTYEGTHFFHQPKPDSAVTDSQGEATVQVAEGTGDWALSAEVEDAEFSYWAGFEEKETSKAATIHVARWPRITVIVPNGYVGPVKIELPLQPDLNEKKSTAREFQFHANSEGYVEINPATYNVSYWNLLNSVTARRIRAVYEDGRPIPSETLDGAGDTTIAMRYVTGSYSEPAKRGRQLYVIGTKKECDAWIGKVSEKVTVEWDVPRAWYEKKLIEHKNYPKEKVFDAYFSESASTRQTK